jgi:Rps23 Pro-64 3,4-dihydroxylase Tpa1-like proline 4-hydroxylase
MKHTIDDFIGVFDDAFSQEFCQEYIKRYEWAVDNGFTRTRQQSEDGIPKSIKHDTTAFSGGFPMISTIGWNDFNNVFWSEIYPVYASEFSEGLTDSTDKHDIYEMRIQKTCKSQGYHVWHHECGTRQTSNRVLFFILYLNDVEEGGETEFLYQSKRVKPKAGRIVISPTGFTHTHRGNPPLSGDKYIITGWVSM